MINQFDDSYVFEPLKNSIYRLYNKRLCLFVLEFYCPVNSGSVAGQTSTFY